MLLTSTRVSFGKRIKTSKHVFAFIIDFSFMIKFVAFASRIDFSLKFILFNPLVHEYACKHKSL